MLKEEINWNRIIGAVELVLDNKADRVDIGRAKVYRAGVIVRVDIKDDD